MYALSEAGVMAANPAPPATHKPGTVGLISPGEVAIKDDRGGLLDAGVVGEIIVRGPSVSPGYLDDPNPGEDGRQVATYRRSWDHRQRRLSHDCGKNKRRHQPWWRKNRAL